MNELIAREFIIYVCVHVLCVCVQMDLNDYSLEGYKMIVGWGKAVKINSAPFVLPPSGGGYVQPEAASAVADGASGPPPTSTAGTAINVSSLPVPVPSPGSVSVSGSTSTAVPPLFPPPPPPPPAGLPPTPAAHAAGPSATLASTAADSASGGDAATVAAAAPVAETITQAPHVPQQQQQQLAVPKEAEMNEDDVQLLVEIPEDPIVKEVIDLVAKFVAADGESFEKVSQSVCTVSQSECMYACTSTSRQPLTCLKSICDAACHAIAARFQTT